MTMTEHKFVWWQRKRLLGQLHRAADVRTYRRTLALLEFDRGEKVSHIAEHLDVDRRSIQRWIASFAKDSDPQALHDASRSGRPPRWTQDTTNLLRHLLNDPPGKWGYLAVNWTMPLLG
jgi:transposase